ncbi:hypothetical protein [Streptomyces pinistramenti]|uniref:hypothetical protein n=1 Tax=Streptomyces pinistramenti TaxID=2884812 RepID=UPI001D080E0C|nr:hypothetical protein [Streptomyces pinistramenti]MCB5910176.1 hypothetical protein [Streptomyces pinistramenti]
MTLTALHRTTTAATTDEVAETANSGSVHRDSPRPAARTHADGLAVASFVFGLLGTLVFNVVLGPCALILGALALARRTTRRGRALLGLALGAADLILLAVLVTTDGTVSWHLTG